MTREKFSLKNALVEHGSFNANSMVEVSDHIYIDSDECKWWFNSEKGLVWVGAKKSFDRWANSRDFVASIPKDCYTLDALVQVIDEQVKCNLYNPKWAEEKDVQGLIRKQKRKSI